MINNPWIGALKKKTGVESTKKKQKKTMGLIFSKQNSQLLNWSLPTGEMKYEQVTFRFSFRILVFFPSMTVWSSLSVSDADFSFF